jgi:hypothetical protein
LILAVLVEAISVIVRVEAIENSYSGRFERFRDMVPNETLACDSELARVGFMSPDDVAQYVGQLENNGLSFLQVGKPIDIAVVDQQQGPSVRCDWLEFGHVQSDGNRIAACRLVGSQESRIFFPEGWRFEGSLSQKFGFQPSGAPSSNSRYRFARSEGGIDVYVDTHSGQEVFMGRTGRRGSTPEEP